MLTKQQVPELPCNKKIDFSEVPGRRILPFKIELDIAASNLNPLPDQNQRFCYNITGVGSDSSTYADLSHIVIGLCDEITQDQITNISVKINGVSQVIIFGEGGNVELKTPENPDPPTGCPGLKFNFSLNKVTGVMNICYELTDTYPIGPNPVCLFGGNVTASGLSICGPTCEPVDHNCPVTGYQKLSVCVPITVTPYARIGRVTTYCCGEPTITPGPAPCPGTANGSCTFTITQQLCVKVPVTFGAYATPGDHHVQCGEVSENDICTNCTPTERPTTFANLKTIFKNK